MPKKPQIISDIIQAPRSSKTGSLSKIQAQKSHHIILQFTKLPTILTGL